MRQDPPASNKNGYNPPSRIRNPELLNEGRARITKAAMQLFSMKGFHDTGVEEIAEAAGLTVGALYKYVRSKHDILFLTSQYMTDAMIERFQPLMASELPPNEKLAAAIDSYLRTMDAFSSSIRMNYRENANLARPARDHLFTLFGSLREGFLAMLRPVAENCGNTDETTLKVIGDNVLILGQMWAVNHRAYAEHVTLDELIRVQAELVFRQLRGSPDATSRDSQK